MGNTADLAVVQKMIIDTLHKEGKSQRVITERCGSSQSAVSKHIKCKVDWKEEIVKEKVHKQQRWPQALEYCQAKLIQTLRRASQGVNWSWSHHARTSSGKGLPSHYWKSNIVRRILPGLRRKITGLLLSGQKSSFQIKVNFAFNLEIKIWSLEEDCRGTESKLLEVQCEVSTVSDDFGCRDVCWCWSILFYQVQSQCSDLESFEHIKLPSADKLFGDADFLSSRTLAPAQCQTTSNWFVDLNPIWNLWDIFKRKTRNSRSNNTDELKTQ